MPKMRQSYTIRAIFPPKKRGTLIHMQYRQQHNSFGKLHVINQVVVNQVVHATA
jgi:hypothetical protein